ncbi:MULTISPECIES: hypothetical protein [Cupriavidus]|uniref:hypothetical protein n=1 Tax=Cupriavidus TaxID=106589 RepID=UPI001E2FD184|nr:MULTISPECIES: hypothetical protein [Cupriavidus]MCD9120497.1 hypothetical protein [Cupriavidus sp. UGS-1]UXC38698.1 hypothetical protein N4G38_17470 [Cupriavidus gilardii]
MLLSFASLLRRRATLPLAAGAMLAALLLAGCGGGDDGATLSPSAAPDTTNPSGKLPGRPGNCSSRCAP